MWKGAITPVLVYFQKPNDAAQQCEGALGKEVSLFLGPCPVQVQQNHITRFLGVADVFQIFRIEGIASIAFVRIVEIEYMEFRRLFVTVEMAS